MEKHDKYKYGTFLFAALFGISVIFSFFLSPVPVTAHCGDDYTVYGQATRYDVVTDSKWIWNPILHDTYNDTEVSVFESRGPDRILEQCQYDQNLIDTFGVKR